MPGRAGRVGDLAGHRYAGVPAGRSSSSPRVLAAALLPGGAPHPGRQLVRAAVDDPQMVACLGVSPARSAPACSPPPARWPARPGCSARPIIGPGPGTADTVLLLSLVVVVLGGLGSMAGTLLAALAVGEIQTLGVALPPTAAPFLLFAAMAAVLAAAGARPAARQVAGRHERAR